MAKDFNSNRRKRWRDKRKDDIDSYGASKRPRMVKDYLKSNDYRKFNNRSYQQNRGAPARKRPTYGNQTNGYDRYSQTQYGPPPPPVINNQTVNNHNNPMMGPPPPPPPPQQQSAQAPHNATNYGGYYAPPPPPNQWNGQQ